MGGWTNPPSGFVDEVEKLLDQQQKRIAVDFIQLVVGSSPVADGAYKGNHRVTVNSVDNGFDLEINDPSGQATISNGIQVVGAAQGAYKEVTIQNNIPYGEKIENGHSLQAPAGVYGPAIATLIAKYGG